MGSDPHTADDVLFRGSVAPESRAGQFAVVIADPMGGFIKPDYDFRFPLFIYYILDQVYMI